MSGKNKSTDAKDDGNVTAVPKLRFPEFRGKDEWEKTQLGSIASFSSGGTPSKDNPEYWNGGIPWVSASSMYDLVVHRADHFVTPLAIGNGTRIAKKGSILILVRGSMLFNRVPICVAGVDVAFNQDVKALDVDVSVDTSFLLYQLSSFQSRFQINETGIGAGKIELDHLKAFELFVPDKAEQRRIAECLSSVDEVIAAQARKVDALKTHKKALMQQLFPGHGETQPRLRFPEFQNDGEWEAKPLSDFVLSLDAGVSVNAGDSRPALKTELGVLKTSAVTTGRFDPGENKVVLAENELIRLREPVAAGTIIICRKNTPALVGASAYVETAHENLFLPDLLWAAKPREGVVIRFLAFILGSDKGRTALSRLAKGSSASMSNIDKPAVLGFLVMAPTPAEQHRIAACLSTLDALITAETQKLGTLKRHKRGLMQQLFPSPDDAEE